jgi:fused signal recognition particle receptor
MADDKKPGFFKRLFGFGKEAPVAPAPEAPPPAETPLMEAPAVDAPPIRDEAAERIAAEIAEAKRAAEAAEAEAAADRARQESLRQAAEAERARAEQERLEAERKAAEAAAEQARIDAARRADEERAKAEEQRRVAEAAAAEARQQAEAKRLADEQRERVEAERLAAERAAEAAAERQRAEAEAAAERARAEAERVAAEQAAAERLAAERAAEERAAAERAAAERAVAEAEAARLAAEAAAVQVPAPAPKLSWWQKLKSGLSRTANTVSDGITGLFTKRKLDDATLEELEDLLIQADLGIDVAARISSAVGKGRYDKEIEPDEVKAILADEVAKVLTPVAQPLVLTPGTKPFVLLMAGVNGSGKTTTIGKLAAKFRAEGKTVMLAAGDTFRAAAIEQLKVWGERTGAQVIARDQGGDAAGLAYDAVKAAQEAGVDVLMIDTAGRLQNRTELMAELEKVIRVIRKLDGAAPHASLLVLDATVGQNALSQVDLFGKTAGITGLVMTKLDGTARGGILVAVAERFKLPIHFIGVGEGVGDLEPFEARDFARAIAGLERLG